jgi:hypothetical protein
MNLYCRQCINEKVAIGRVAFREYKKKAEGRKQQAGVVNRTPVLNLRSHKISRELRKLEPADRVRAAIRYGSHTQKEIAQVTRLSKDEVCDALANLILWTREIATRIIRHQRMYFANEPGQAPTREPVRPRAPRSYGVSDAYSSVYLQDVYAEEAAG